MAKTNWQDPKTGEIISPHISGLQEAVRKLEESIGMEYLAESDIPLLEVFISNDDRCRIYQAQEGKRNWLLSPTPIVKKNGIIITNDFEIDYGGGAVIFTTPILETDVLTADATYTKKIEGKQLSTNDYTDEEKLKNQNNKESIESLAGVGRIYETVKGNADSILNLISKVGNTENLDTEEKTDLVLALNEVYNNLTTHEADMATQDDIGHVQFATTTEVVEGIETTKAISPDTLKTRIASRLSLQGGTLSGQLAIQQSSGTTQLKIERTTTSPGVFYLGTASTLVRIYNEALTQVYQYDMATGVYTLLTGTTHGEVSGSPEGAVAAKIGSTRCRIDTGELYLKTMGNGNTGWKAVQIV
ncbi:hypothetical protein [Tissierella sp.]|uniref:hypothetical protein n=1 Tax=Tissierella sp. TaxID=41274 RepID=UPI002855E8EC|nr:hypothetical protein [Tissierella sp.]MDR7856072.1 hypothetical protein [Tissierella sp.]